MFFFFRRLAYIIGSYRQLSGPTSKRPLSDGGLYIAVDGQPSVLARNTHIALPVSNHVFIGDL